MDKPSYLDFDYSNYAWKADIDYRAKPEQYRVGKGEQGVLICEPYKSEIGKFWRFRTPEIAKHSSQKIHDMFIDYLKSGEFVGADMARKYLQMGYTRSRRYANYRGGKKYDPNQNYLQLERGTGEDQKAISASIFYEKWKLAERNERYTVLKKQWKNKYG